MPSAPSWAPSSSVVSAAAEAEDFGQYNVEYLDISDSSFANIGGSVIDVYRGGRDESTFGPFVSFAGNALSDVGLAVTNGSGASMNLHGVQIARVSGNAVAASAPLRVIHTVGTPDTAITGNSFTDTPAMILEEINYEGEHRALLSDNAFAESMAE